MKMRILLTLVIASVALAGKKQDARKAAKQQARQHRRGGGGPPPGVQDVLQVTVSAPGLTGRLDSLQQQDTALGQQINNVAVNAQQQDQNLLGMVNNVAQNAQAVDIGLQVQIDNVAINAKVVDDVLSDEIYNVAVNAENEDKAIEDQVSEGFLHVAQALDRNRVTDEQQTNLITDLQVTNDRQDKGLVLANDELRDHADAIHNTQQKTESLAIDMKKQNKEQTKFRNNVNIEFDHHRNSIQQLQTDSAQHARKQSEFVGQIIVLEHNDAQDRSHNNGKFVDVDSRLQAIDGQIDNIDNVVSGITLSNMAAIGLIQQETDLKLQDQRIEIDAVAQATIENNAMILATATDVETLDLELDALAVAWNQTTDGLSEDIDDVAQDVLQTRNTMAAANDSLNNAVALEARTRAEKDNQIVNVMGGIQNEVRDLTEITERQEDVLEQELGISSKINDTVGAVNQVNLQLANQINNVAQADAAAAQKLSNQITSTNQHIGQNAHQLMQTIEDVKDHCLARSDEVEGVVLSKVAALEGELAQQKQLNQEQIRKIAGLETAQVARIQTIEKLTLDLEHLSRVVHELVNVVEDVSAVQQLDVQQIDALRHQPRVIVDIDPIQQGPSMYYAQDPIYAMFQG